MPDLEIRIPDIGDFRDVPVLEVLVHPGDRVEVEDPLVALESDKATMEIPSPSAGVVRSITVQPGDKVSQGSAILTLETNVVAALNAAETPKAAGVPRPEPPAAKIPAAEAPVAEVPATKMPAATPAERATEPSSNGVVHASPSVRRFARELGVDLHVVTGTGPHARVTHDDVQHFVKRSLAAPTAATGAAPAGTPFDLPPWPKIDFARYGEIETIPLSRIRKLSGANLHRNWVSIPHVTNNDEADITELEAFRKSLNAEYPGAKVTMLAFIIKAVVAALVAHPDVNASLDGDTLVRKKYYNIGFAADTPGGLVVPVLKAADTKGVLAIASETGALAAKAREGKLGAADMAGASFTISSLGGIGGTSFTPIVNAPEVAILGVSRSAMWPVWDGTEFVPRLMLPLSLSYDHRVIDGALAARFNATLTRLLGDLRRVML
jgi:pyruvate dehydrogenase E2 component (dihydrolipoamide acetyltransferase)